MLKVNNFKIPIALFTLLAFGRVDAAIMTTMGAGTVVSSADRTATFDDLGVTVSDLLGYTEDGLLVSVNDKHSSYAGKHYGRGGNKEFVTISTTDSVDFFGLELDLYTGFAAGLHNVVWEARKDNLTIDSGVLYDVFAQRGSASDNTTTLGFYDLNLFDTLLIGAGLSSSKYDQFGKVQAIALDNLRIGFKGNDSQIPVPVPAPPTLWLLATGLAGLMVFRKRMKEA